MQDTERAVERLTEIHAVTVNGAIGHCGPLLEMLYEARYPNIGRTKGGGGTGDILDMKAVTMWEAIDGGVRAWLDHYRQPYGDDLIAATKRLHETLKGEHAGGRLEDPDHMFAMFPTWVQRIEDMFDPPREYELTEKCPECEAEHILVGDEPAEGERDERPLAWAVRMEVKEGRALIAECHACGRMWAGQDALVRLAEAMGLDVDWVALREFAGRDEKETTPV